MRLIKFDKDYTRRQCLESLGKGFVGAGILMPLFDAWANSGDVRAAYPDEALQIETYSKGAVKPGGMLDAGNVDSVKDLLDPITYIQVKQHGRVYRVKDTTTDINLLNPVRYTEATARNAGKARLNDKGNVVLADGKPWIGGNPFPKPASAQEICATLAMGWGRHDQSSAPTHMEIVDGQGNTQYTYEFYWVEVLATTRYEMDPKPYMPGHEDKLRYVTFVSTYPSSQAGAVALNIWPYDQNQFPQIYAYAPDFKRIRRTSGNQRFEPMMQGSSFMVSDTWMLGDPYMTWGNFKMVGKTPFMGCMSGNWNASDPNWFHARTGGPNGKKFPLNTIELIPECYVVDLEPTHYANAPMSKKRIWVDARTMVPVMMVLWDRDGRLWQGYAGSYSTYAKDGQVISGSYPNPDKVPYWAWCALSMHDMKTDEVTMMTHTKQITGGWTVKVNDPTAYEHFCTVEALQQLGA
jgi:hypothetical protein